MDQKKKHFPKKMLTHVNKIMNTTLHKNAEKFPSSVNLEVKESIFSPIILEVTVDTTRIKPFSIHLCTERLFDSLQFVYNKKIFRAADIFLRKNRFFDIRAFFKGSLDLQ